MCALIAQLVEYRTGIAEEVTGLNPVLETLIFSN